MTGPQVTALPRNRLHLHHGPIDLILSADGPPAARDAAYAAAVARFATLLGELADELPLLRRPPAMPPRGAVASLMFAATAPHLPNFITPMAAVAGAVADTILKTMTDAADLTRAMVNNGGDIAVYLAKGEIGRIAILSPAGMALGHLSLDHCGTNGLATSGFGGRSQTLGIAEAVTVLAPTAAMADAAATLIANAVDLPGHPYIRRVPATDLHLDSDLQERRVTTSVGALLPSEIDTALARGAARANAMRARGLISAAALFLRGQTRTVGPLHLAIPAPERSLSHA